MPLESAGVGEKIIMAILAAARVSKGPSAPQSESEALPARTGGHLSKDGTAIPSPVADRYLVIAGAGATPFRDRLQAVGARGFRPHPAGISYPSAVIMEKAADGTDGFRYLFLEGLNPSKLQQRLAEVSPQGYRVVGANASVVILGKPAKTREEPVKAGAREIADPRQALLAARTVAVLSAWGQRAPGDVHSYEADPPTAKQKVEEAIRKWGRFAVLDDPGEADLILLVIVRSNRMLPQALSNELLVYRGGGVPGPDSVALWQSGDTKALWGYAATKVATKFREYVQELEKKAPN